jgi:type I restriction enzyme M protein
MIYAFDVISEKIRLQEFSDQEKERWRFELSSQCLYGTDWKERTSQACKMNMMVHGDGSSGVFMHDGFTNVPGVIEEDKFDICLTNPPFGSLENDPETLARYELGAGRKTQDRVILAVERALNLVRPGGQIGIVVIDGVLNTKSRRYVREHLKRRAWIRAVISLNSETFEGYGAQAKTRVLFLQKKDAPSEELNPPAFMAIARNTGLAPNGDPIPGNVLPDVLLDYRAFRRGEMQVGQVGKHSESFCVKLAARLDAEFYGRRVRPSGADYASVRQEIASVQSEVATAFAKLAELTKTLNGMKTETIRLGDILEEAAVSEDIDPDRVYRLLSVRWWEEGVFIREEKTGRNVKTKKLYRVSAGNIIYNRLFAFRGSFAIVNQEHDGCHTSNEFPTFKPKNGIENGGLLCRYIVHCLNSPQYLAIVDAESTGSTKKSRNRFNEDEFADLSVQVPQALDGLRAAVDMLDTASAVKRYQDRLLALTKSLREEALRMLPEPTEA